MSVPFPPMPASQAVAIDEPFAPRPSWWQRLINRLAPIIPDGHPDTLGSLDRLERGSAEHHGPLKHDGLVPATPTWEDLSVAEAVEEMRLGEQSAYAPDFEDDPRVWADCPNCGRIPVGPDGCCNWGCGYDFMSSPVPVEDNRAALS